MTRSISSPKVNFKMSGSLRNTLTDDSSVSVAQPNFNYSPTLTNGVSANQVNRAWQSEGRSIVEGAQETINVSTFDGLDIGAGDGMDALGQALDLEEIVAIVIQNDGAVTAAGRLEIIPANSHGWDPIGSHTVANGGALRGQGVLIKAQVAEAGFDVAPGTTDRITMRAVGGAVTYSIYILGRHDDGESSSSSQSSSSSSESSSSSSSASSSVSTSSISTSSVSSSSSSISTSSSSSSQSDLSSSSSSSESSSSLS